MFVQESTLKVPFFIQAYEDRQLIINKQAYASPLVIFEAHLETDLLPFCFEDFAEDHLRQLVEFKPELILIGTGPEQKFLEHQLLSVLNKRKIGIEVMNTLSACRTFNLLMEEDRKVLGAFFP